MIPLIDETLYAELLRVRGEMNDGTRHLAQPFIPVGPDPSAGASVRLLFVGQASYQWAEYLRKRASRRGGKRLPVLW